MLLSTKMIIYRKMEKLISEIDKLSDDALELIAMWRMVINEAQGEIDFWENSFED